MVCNDEVQDELSSSKVKMGRLRLEVMTGSPKSKVKTSQS